MEELNKWSSQQYAVNILNMRIFKIDEVELVGDEVIIYSGENTNTSKRLMTLKEAEYFEKIKKSLDDVFLVR
jgi:hypothetical protein